MYADALAALGADFKSRGGIAPRRAGHHRHPDREDVAESQLPPQFMPEDMGAPNGYRVVCSERLLDQSSTGQEALVPHPSFALTARFQKTRGQ